MDVLWDHGEPMLVRDVVRALSERDLAYTTLMTVLNRLAHKDFVRRELDGRAWRYAPRASREEYVTQLMLEALSFTGDREAALAHFAHSVSVPEAEVLSQALADAGEKSDGGDDTR